MILTRGRFFRSKPPVLYIEMVYNVIILMLDKDMCIKDIQCLRKCENNQVPGA